MIIILNHKQKELLFEEIVKNKNDIIEILAKNTFIINDKIK